MTVAGGDMVHSTGIPRVAFREPAGCEPTALHSAMHCHGLKRVRRARRKEPADLAVERRDHFPVRLEKEDEDVARQLPEKRAHGTQGTCVGRLAGRRNDGGAYVMHAVSLPLWSRCCPAKHPGELIHRVASSSPPVQRCSPRAVAPSWQTQLRAEPELPLPGQFRASARKELLLLSVSS